MTDTSRQWTRTEGIIIAEHLDPKEVADFINQTRVVVSMDWYERTPNLIGLTLVEADRKLAAVNDVDEVVPMVEFEDFALEVAQRFDAEVLIGGVAADAMPEGAEVSGDVDYAVADETMRIVELSSIPDSSIPLAAAISGVDLAALALDNDWQALAYESEYSVTVASFGDYPIVTLMVSDDEFHASLAEDDDPESLIMYNWSMSARTLAAGHMNDRVFEEAEELVGSSADLRRIAEAVPGADVVAAEATAQLSGTRAVLSFVRALGAPGSIADYLLGKLEVDEIPGAESHDARGISNAIGRSVDRMLLEPESTGNPVWETYHKVAVEKPQIVRTVAGIEGAIGGILLANAFRGDKPRTGWTKFSGIVGGLMVFDSIAEVMLAKYLGKRAERRSGK
ncbi:MAG: hypothetical protein Q4D87_05240 [Actinomycetaceae bacterium]|nr:hypothetical protein [Actinomycetaceae bacterium]